MLVNLRTLYLRRQARQLQRQIDEQTRDLRAANRRLDELAAHRRTDRRLQPPALSGTGRETARTWPEEGSICIALFDLDRFKQVNDTYGHLAGDAVIRTTIEVVRQHCRQHDLVGRYGGEEFVLCLPDTSLPQAMEIAERIRAALARHRGGARTERRSRSRSVSAWPRCVRVSPSSSGCRAPTARMYEAKHNGRNRCVTAD